ncbi:MAG TPA: alternative ribosome rescue aminoacyl-tRNA hydrolase ArfB [Actinomycetes bacterium]|jgi:ribosome-associated protein|nr:alternative ribosome rescue aminoacyl-tRNA hydrolase ArfB [Actinomycetes bacterium]
MAEVVRITPELEIPLEELEFRTSRASGPGGQGVNTTDSRVELRFDLAGSPSLPPEARERALRRLAARLDSAGHLRVVAQTQRSQLANRRDAIERFAALLATAVAAPRERRPTRPSAAAAARRRELKRQRAITKRLRQRPPPTREQ